MSDNCFNTILCIYLFALVVTPMDEPEKLTFSIGSKTRNWIRQRKSFSHTKASQATEKLNLKSLIDWALARQKKKLETKIGAEWNDLWSRGKIPTIPNRDDIITFFARLLSSEIIFIYCISWNCNSHFFIRPWNEISTFVFLFLLPPSCDRQLLFHFISHVA